ncbi:MAG: glucose 1-dehydrogenase [Caldilineaceae bacterium]|nr:glucose 1-dehydrogenase [Caldilineaceae bacterium]
MTISNPTEATDAAPLQRGRGRLQDKVAIITGSARGIGAATAITFAREGAQVVICDIMAEQGKELASQLNSTYANGRPTAIFVPADVTNANSVANLVQQTVHHFGKLDILVNNAGITRDAQLKKMDEEDFDLVVDINLKGVFLCGKAAANQMLVQGHGGVILNAASIVGIDGNFGQTNYVATKSAVIGMTKVWARELGPKGIRVNALAPGFIDTPMTAQMPEKIYNMMVERTPLRRAGVPEDVANAYLWLASDEAAFINGVVLRVDGGIVIGT